MNLEIVLAVVAVCTLALGAAAVAGQFRVSRNTGAVNAYRDSAQGWESLARTKDAEMTEMRVQIAALQAENSALKGRMQAMENIVTGKSMIEELSRDIDAKYETLVARLDGISSSLGTQTGGAL